MMKKRIDLFIGVLIIVNAVLVIIKIAFDIRCFSVETLINDIIILLFITKDGLGENEL